MLGVPGAPGGGKRRLRADARRNRQRVIEVACELFGTEGLGVPVQEIARCAGVGTGTVSRHFPTKQALFKAVFLSRVDRLVRIGQALALDQDPGEAFFAFLSEVVSEGIAHKGLAEALAGDGFDLGAIKCDGTQSLMDRMQALLLRAQDAGEVRADVGIDDVKALVTGCLTRDAGAQDRMLSIVQAGLRPGQSGNGLRAGQSGNGLRAAGNDPGAGDGSGGLR